MHNILRPPFWHVTTHTIRRGRMFNRERCSMALAAHAVVVQRGLFTAWNVMRIVARGAREFAGASQETLRFAQPVRRVRDFKIILVLAAWSVIEEDHEITQRLAGLAGKWLPAVPLDGMRQVQAGGFKVALHTYFHLTLAA